MYAVPVILEHGLNAGTLIGEIREIYTDWRAGTRIGEIGEIEHGLERLERWNTDWRD